jgi:3-deoxy-D-manno-octulosonic acid (KDO) 8-phosphate synthase
MDGKEMDLINENFRQINEKLDKLTELANKTNLQEYRIQQLEEELKVMKNNKRDALWRVLTPVLSAICSAIVTFVIAGGFLIK